MRRSLRIARLLLSALTAASIGVGALVAQASSASAAQQVCLTGALKYDHADAEAGTRLPLASAFVRGGDWKLYDRATPSATTAPLAVGQTDGAGKFNACYSPPTTAARDLYLRFDAASAGRSIVVKNYTASNQAYNFTKKVAAVQVSKAIGVVKAPAAMAGAFKVVDTLQNLWAIRANPVSNCWTKQEASNACTPMTFVWPYSSGGFFDLTNTKFVFFDRVDTNSKHTILHEAGHLLQYRLHGNQFPDVENCEYHEAGVETSGSCAWTEGFANAVAAYALGDTRYTYSDGTYIDMAAGVEDEDWATGDTVEGRVTGALLALWAPNGTDGNWNASISSLTMSIPLDFSSYFWETRPLAGLGTSPAELEILANHTIRYE